MIIFGGRSINHHGGNAAGAYHHRDGQRHHGNGADLAGFSRLDGDFVALFNAHIGFGRIVVAVHHRNGNQQHQNAAAHLKRTHADAQKFEQCAAGKREDTNGDQHGKRGDLRHFAPLFGAVVAGKVEKDRQSAKRVDQHHKSQNQLADLHAQIHKTYPFSAALVGNAHQERQHNHNR